MTETDSTTHTDGMPRWQDELPPNARHVWALRDGHPEVVHVSIRGDGILFGTALCAEALATGRPYHRPISGGPWTAFLSAPIQTPPRPTESSVSAV